MRARPALAEPATTPGARAFGGGAVVRIARACGIGATLWLAACSPQDAADAVTRQAAGSVVQPIVEAHMQPAQAEGVTRCLLDAASPGEIRALAQDVGTSGGTRPRANVAALATRPAARACIAAAGLPQLPGVL